MDSLPPGTDLSVIPMGTPPPGVQSNLIDPPSSAGNSSLATYTTLPVMLISVGLRMYARLKTRATGLDDYICFCAVATTIAASAVLMNFYTDERLGRHFWDIPMSIVVDSNFMPPLVNSMFLVVLSGAFMRLSVLALYFRLFRPSRYANILIWVGATVIIVCWIISTVLNGVFCMPHAGDGGWGSAANMARCDRAQTIVTCANSIVGLVADVYILAIPLGFLSTLNLSRTKKFGVAAIFLTALIACALAIAGVVVRMRLLLADPPDWTWHGSIAMAMYVAETNIGIACSCMPAIASLFRGWITSFKSTPTLIKKYIGSWPKRRTSRSKDSDLSELKSPDALPSVPKGTLTGLASFFRKGRSSQNATRQTNTQVSTNFELQSADYDYHAYVHRGKPSASHLYSPVATG